MKTKFLVISLKIFLVLLLGWFLQPALAQNITAPGVWQPHGPIFNAEITSLLVTGDIYNSQDPLLIYLGTRGTRFDIPTGVFRSKNGGTSWIPAEPPFDRMNIETMFLVDGKVFMSAHDFYDATNTGLYYSTDRGESWERAAGGMQDKIVLSMISDAGTLYAGATQVDEYENVMSFGLFTSADGGQTWSPVSAMQDVFVTNLLTANGRIYAGTRTEFSDFLYRTDGVVNGVFISADGGASWSQQLPDQGIETLFAAGDTVFAGTTANGLFYATGEDTDWRAVDTPLNTGRVRNITSVFRNNFDTLVASRDNSLLISTNQGAAWREVFQAQNPITVLISDLYETAPYLYAGTRGDGVFRSDDLGETWSPPEAPIELRSSEITTLVADRDGFDTYAGTTNLGIFRAPNGGNVWFPTALYNTAVPIVGVTIAQERALFAYGIGVFRSLDAGLTWQRADLKTTWNAVADLIHDPDTERFFLGVSIVDETRQFNPDELGVWRSDDGLTWTRTNLNNVEIRKLVSLGAGDALIAGGEGGVYISYDDGENWDHTFASSFVNVLLQTDDSKIFAGTDESGVYYSEDGRSWIQAEGEIRDKSVTSLYEFDGKVFAGTDGSGIFYGSSSDPIWVKAEAQDLVESETAITSFAALDNSLIVAGTDNQGLYSSIDGNEWQPANPPMQDKAISSLLEVDGVLYAATSGDGVFRSKDDGFTWTPLEAELDYNETFNLQYLRIANRLYLTTLGGVYSQELDLINPVLDYFDVGGGNRFENPFYTNSRKIRFFIWFAFDSLADGSSKNPDFMRVSENPDFSDTTGAWKAYNDNTSFTEPNFTINSPGEGVKTIYAQVRDYSWNLSEVLSWDITLDQTKPQFDSHTPPSGARVGQPITVRFSVTEPNIESITFRLRRPGQQWDSRRSFPFSANTDGAFEYEFIGEFVSNGGLDYRIIVTDLAGNVDSLRSNTLDFVSLPVNLNEGELGNSTSLPAGTGAGSYRMVSAPMNLQNAPAVKDIFKNLGDYGRRGNWRFYAYQGNSQWQEGESIPMQTGAGYFMIRRDGGPLTNKMAGATTPTSDGITGQIPGWHLRANDWTLIGNPYNTRLSLGQLKLKNIGMRLDTASVADIWLYDGSWKKPETTPDLALEAWGGLFVRVAQADTIIFDNAADPFKPVGKISLPPDDLVEPTVSAGVRLVASGKNAPEENTKISLPEFVGVEQLDKARPQKQKSHRKENARMQFSRHVDSFGENRLTQSSSINNSPGETIAVEKSGSFLNNLAENEWLVQIIATSQEASDEVNYFGVRKEAKEALDKHDWYEPPFMLAGVNLTFPHADWDTPVELAADVRPVAGEGHRWEIAIKGEPTHAAQLNFVNLESVPDDQHILLLDETSKIIYDLRKESALAVRIPEAGVKNLVILTGSDFFINKHTEGMLGVPTSFALHQNYPNPFNPSTTIRYQLPVAGQVTLKIFDMMGREALTLEENKSREPGYYEMVADMKALGSGVYFYRLDIAGEQKFQATKKMLYVK